MNIDNIYHDLIANIPANQVLMNEPMKNHTSFKIGGPADIVVIPSQVEHIRHIMMSCQNGMFPS